MKTLPPTPKIIFVGLFFIASLPYFYLNGSLDKAITLGLSTFSGRLESVNTGCFSDGECYAVISGKHVTILKGFSREEAGQVLGEDGIGGLTNHIGENVSVYAKRLSFSNFTLIGSRNYYIKVASKGIGY